jgi:penicillin amidase
VIKFTEEKKNFKTNANESFQVNRQPSGITEIHSSDLNTTAFAQAITHCNDRFIQIFLLRIIGQGRISELLDSNEETNGIDKFMRQMNFHGSSVIEEKNLKGPEKEFFQSYTDGINHFLTTHGKVWEFKLLKVNPEPWKVEDSLMIIKIMSYIGLAQTQQDAEKLIIQLIRNKVDIEKIKDLFSPHLNEVTSEIIEDLCNLSFFEGLIPEDIKFLSEIPKFIASNNWIVSGEKSSTENVIQCNDPHLEVNRLPAIWYEQLIHTNAGNFHGMTMPGVPGLIMGRSDHVSFGFTYGFMDMIDYFIEDVKDNKFDRDGESKEFKIRKEIIKRKKNSNLEYYFFENETGTLETPNDKDKLQDGKFLNMAWSCKENGAIGSAKALYEMFQCYDVHSLKEALSNITISCNWLVGDTKGNIAYQQSGQFPHRKESGLYPLHAKNSDNLWKGIRPKSDLLSVVNPDCGFLATANNDLKEFLKEDSPLSINLPMGPYRVNRINSLLSSKEKFSIEELKKMQSDLYSIQAEEFLKDLSPYLGDDCVSEELKSWDKCYDRESTGALVFEYYYHELLKEVFQKDFTGTEAWEYIAGKSSILVDFYFFFDQILLGDENSIWFKDKLKSDCIKSALEHTKEKFKSHRPKWKEEKSTPMKNILFDGKLPNFLGFDYGPIVIEGCRATIVQGALYEAHGRISTFCPSMRFVTDLGERKSYTVLAGGVSDRRFSNLYTNEVEMWLNFEYKEINLS